MYAIFKATDELRSYESLWDFTMPETSVEAVEIFDTLEDALAAFKSRDYKSIVRKFKTAYEFYVGEVFFVAEAERYDEDEPWENLANLLARDGYAISPIE